MARSKKSQTEVTTAEQGMTMILDTPVEKSIDEAAKVVGVAEIRLLEMFADRLELPEAMGWETVPSEHESLLAEFKQQQDAFNSVRALEPEPVAEATQEPIATPELPVIEDEQQPTKRRGRPKKESTALTQRKSSSLKESDQKSQKLASSDQQLKVKLHAVKGQKSGAQLATIELAAEDATYRQIKGQALVRKVGQLTSEIAAESDFDPIQVLAELGIDSNSEIFEDLKEQIDPALGKLESATAEIVDNAWVNGIDLESELSALEELMNSKKPTPYLW
jgi:flagellar motor protein MotB